MRSKSILLLGLALACGLVASIGISQVMERRSQQSNPTEMDPIFVALTDINPNDPLTAHVIKLEEWPRDKIPSGAITKLEEVDGKRARTKLFAGEPILRGKLLGGEGSISAANQVPMGYRIVWVKVDAVSSGSGLILPGDRVDVLVTPTGLSVAESQTKTILQNIRIFAVDTTMERAQDQSGEPVQAKTIGLQVTPEQAEVVGLAQARGEIRLVMRNPDDEQEVHTPGKTMADLVGTSLTGSREKEQSPENKKPPAATKADAAKQSEDLAENKDGSAGTANDPWKMVVLEGSQVREVEFDANNPLPIDTTPPGENPNREPATDSNQNQDDNTPADPGKDLE